MSARHPAVLPPILVTGAHRSGTTWLGKVLGLSPRLAIVHEPLNVSLTPSWLADPPSRWFETPQPGDALWEQLDEAIALRFPLRPNLERVRRPKDLAKTVIMYGQARVHRAQRRTALVKDPFAVFAAAAFTQRYRGRAVISVKHPAAYADSIQRRAWDFDFGHLASQGHLMSGLLSSSAPKILAAAERRPPRLEQAALIWRVVYSAVAELAAGNDQLVVIRNEDLASDPLNKFPGLFEILGLDWDSNIERDLRAFTFGKSPDSNAEWKIDDVHRDSAATLDAWKTRMSEQDLHRVREVIGDLWDEWYPTGPLND